MEGCRVAVLDVSDNDPYYVFSENAARAAAGRCGHYAIPAPRCTGSTPAATDFLPVAVDHDLVGAPRASRPPLRPWIWRVGRRAPDLKLSNLRSADRSAASPALHLDTQTLSVSST
jgi:hypothetical protein